MPKIGFHLGNRGNPWQPQFTLMDKTKASILLAMEPVTPNILRQWAVRNQDNILVLRKHFAPSGKATKPEVMDWVNGQVEMAHRYLAFPEFQNLYDKGNLFIKIFNEPNFSFEGFGQSSEAMKLYNELYILAATKVRDALPKAKRVGYSLAPGNGDVYFSGDYKNSHYYFHGPEASKENPSESEIIAAKQSCLTREAQAYMDVLGIHVYPLPDTWNNIWLGKRFVRYWKFLPSHLVDNTYILEASVADEAGQEVRASQTYQWLEMLRTYNQIKGVTLWWLRPGDNTWEKHFFTNTDESPRPVYYAVSDFIEKYGQPQGETPEEPPESPTDPVEREVVNPPEWDSFNIVDANVKAGEYYWKLVYFKMLTEEEADGNHHINILDPHTDKADLRVHNTGNNVVEVLPLDTKPDNEPAQNYAMWAHTEGNEYNVDLVGLPSDKVTGLRMEGNRHISFNLTFKRVQKSEVQASFYQYTISKGEENLVMPLNPNAALQKRILKDDFVPNSPEFSYVYDNIEYVGQRAENLETGEVRVYYAQKGEWDKVSYVTR